MFAHPPRPDGSLAMILTTRLQRAQTRWCHLLAAGLIGLLSACGSSDDAQRKQLDQAVGQVARILNDASRNPMAAAALQSTLEGGGTLNHYVVASLPDKFTHAVAMDKPSRAWSVVVKAGANPDEAKVEGYGTDLTNPLFTRTAKIGPPPKRR